MTGFQNPRWLLIMVNSPHKGQWRGALMFWLSCIWIYSWVNNRVAGDLRRYCTHYDVIVMITGLTFGRCLWDDNRIVFDFQFWLMSKEKISNKFYISLEMFKTALRDYQKRLSSLCDFFYLWFTNNPIWFQWISSHPFVMSVAGWGTQQDCSMSDLAVQDPSSWHSFWLGSPR